MKCKECQKEGKVSRITLGACTSTLVSMMASYYDEDGTFHEGTDPNTIHQEYTCSNGHSWREVL